MTDPHGQSGQSGQDGSYAELDTFTDYDRALLEDRWHREVARTQTPIGGGIVQAYERREIFTFHEPEIGTLRFDVRGIKRALLDGRLKASMYRIEIDPKFYEHVLANNGVEPERIGKLSERDLQRPGIMIQWPHGHSTLIDGNHRLCGLYRRGVKTFRFLLVNVMDAVPFMCRPGDERRLFDSDKEADGDAIRLHSQVWIDD
jgi:hypothetical protein